MLKTKAGVVIGKGGGTAYQLNLFQDEQDLLLTRSEAAAYLRRSTATLEQWSRSGLGPVVVRMGPRGIRYRLSDLRRFVEEGTRVADAE